MKSAHWYLGIATVIVFLSTGLYMRQHAAELLHANDVIRFMSRANHIYILASGLLNIMLGVYLNSNVKGWKRKLQIAGSIFILAAPLFLIPAFFVEPLHASADYRHFTFFGILFLLIGTLCHVSASKKDIVK